MTKQPAILIADDHSVVRRGVRQILMSEFPHATIADVDNEQAAREQFTRRSWDVLILDINLPGGDGLNLLREIKRGYPTVGVIILTMHPAEQLAVRVFRDGASSYLSKDCVDDDLVKAVRNAIQGRRYFTSKVAEVLASFVEEDKRKALHEKLSDREYQIFQMLAAGKSTSLIATELSLSVQTVCTHRKHILEKMGLSKNVDLISYAWRSGLMQ